MGHRGPLVKTERIFSPGFVKLIQIPEILFYLLTGAGESFWHFIPAQLRGSGGTPVLGALRCCRVGLQPVRTPSGDCRECRTWCAGGGGLVREVGAMPVTFVLDS